MRQVRSGASYLSQDDLRQHFGLGAEKKVGRIEVVWPDGTTSTRENLTPNQIVEIKQP